MDLLATIVNTLRAELRYDRRYHAECPFCHKEAKRGQKHFSFCEQGYSCWVCGAKGGLTSLASHIDTNTFQQPSRLYQKPQEPQKPRHWQQNPQAIVDASCASLDRVRAWQAYKPLTIETIARWRLGVGMLPSSKCKHRRLIVPIFVSGQIVALRGRAIDCDCPKWLSAAGSQVALYNQDLLQPGADVIVCENHVDALLAMQDSGVIAVAGTGGAATWKQEWTEAIVASSPRRVIVWYDNDLAGQPNAETLRAELFAWRQAHPDGWRAPQPNGPKVANALRDAGINATLYHWPAGTPAKADVGWALMQQQEQQRRAA